MSPSAVIAVVSVPFSGNGVDGVVAGEDVVVVVVVKAGPGLGRRPGVEVTAGEEVTSGVVSQHRQ